MRLIDADELKRDLEIAPYNDYDDFLRTERLIDDAPTIESLDLDIYIGGRRCGKKQRLLDELRPKGKWVYTLRDSENDEYRCSNCDYPQGYNPNFCPNCGADMRGDV